MGHRQSLGIHMHKHHLIYTHHWRLRHLITYLAAYGNRTVAETHELQTKLNHIPLMRWRHKVDFRNQLSHMARALHLTGSKDGGLLVYPTEQLTAKQGICWI